MDWLRSVDGRLATPSTTTGGAARWLHTNLVAMRPAYAVKFLVTNVSHATGVAAARLGRAVSSLRSRHDPYMYKEVVDDILEKHMHRHLIEKEEAAMSSWLKCIVD